MRRFFKISGVVVLLLLAFIIINNNNWFSTRPAGEPTLLAHRGVAQRFSTEGLNAETCTAAQMLQPTHGFLENTIALMQASFDTGATIAEVDIHPTTDGQFAVFHDWTLDCRTNGSGVTREHAMPDLRQLDIGYGYTADGGKTFPFRGQGVGLMPTLDDVLTHFSNRSFVINVKSRDLSEGDKLAAYLAALSPERRASLVVYGGGSEVLDLVQARLPDIRIMSTRTLMDCLARYVALGWTGIMPGACKHTIMLVPINIAPWLWGWPDRFLDRMDSAGTQVFVAGPYFGGGFTTGIDTLDQLAQLPKGYSGGIWTNEIELIGPASKN
ncbi:MAG TPA: glycerophosphodiester phosphodiesterase family protein [Devosia sp.]|nr:glycerophosphodiester phosphodiesterase family protein [Devosia sp.]